MIAPLIFIALAIIATTGLPGLIFALAWLGVGVWFVVNTRSRGWIADAAFVVTWPIHLWLERDQ